MELANYKACICEGSAENAIMDILLDYNLSSAWWYDEDGTKHPAFCVDPKLAGPGEIAAGK